MLLFFFFFAAETVIFIHSFLISKNINCLVIFEMNIMNWRYLLYAMNITNAFIQCEVNNYNIFTSAKNECEANAVFITRGEAICGIYNNDQFYFIIYSLSTSALVGLSEIKKWVGAGCMIVQSSICFIWQQCMSVFIISYLWSWSLCYKTRSSCNLISL